MSDFVNGDVNLFCEFDSNLKNSLERILDEVFLWMRVAPSNESSWSGESSCGSDFQSCYGLRTRAATVSLMM